MHRGGGQQRRDGRVGRVDAAIAHDEDARARADGAARRGAELVDGAAEVRLGVALGRKQRHERRGAEVGRGVGAQLRELVLGEDRVRQLEHAPLARRLLEEVALAADAADERHHDLLAERVDRRVGHLREVLLEVAKQQLGLLAQHRERDVDAHRPDGLLARDGHGADDHAQVLVGVAERLLQRGELVGRDPVEARRVGELAEVDLVVGDPLRVGLARRDAVLDLVVGDDAPLDGVDEEHLAGLQAPLLHDARGLDVEHAELAGEHDQAVARHDVLGRAQAVAVEGGADELAVGEAERGGAVPGLDEAAVVLVKRLLLGRHVRVERPGLGHEHHHHVRQRAAAREQEVDDVVERGRVAATGPDDRLEVLDRAGEQIAREQRLARAHPRGVAAQRVDLAVVRDEAVGVRALPGRERVGREARVHHREARDGARVGEVGVERRDLLGEHEPLVDDGLRRARRDVEVVGARGAAGALADGVERALEGLDGAGALDEELTDGRLRAARHGADRARVGRDVTPAEHLLAVVHDRGLEDGLELAAPGRLAREEAGGDGVVAGGGQGDALGAHLGGVQRVGDLQQDAGAVARARVAAGCAAVGEVLEDLEGLADDGVRGLAAGGRDEPEPASVMLEGGVVEALATGKRHGRIDPRGGAYATRPCIQRRFDAARKGGAMGPTEGRWPM